MLRIRRASARRGISVVEIRSLPPIFPSTLNARTEIMLRTRTSGGGGGGGGDNGDSARCFIWNTIPLKRKLRRVFSWKRTRPVYGVTQQGVTCRGKQSDKWPADSLIHPDDRFDVWPIHTAHLRYEPTRTKRNRISSREKWNSQVYYFGYRWPTLLFTGTFTAVFAAN